jgi:hypothetical protein
MRKRKYISLSQKLAAALACLLPQKLRDEVRTKKIPAAEVIGMFEWDHVHLHSLGGSSDWDNLDPKLKADHREKSRSDTSIAAKVKRLQAKPPPRMIPAAEALITMLTKADKPKRKIPQRMNAWPPRGSRKIANGRTRQHP